MLSLFLLRLGSFLPFGSTGPAFRFFVVGGCLSLDGTGFSLGLGSLGGGNLIMGVFLAGFLAGDF